MTTREVTGLLKIISATYPSFNTGRDPMVTVNIWQAIFGETPADIVVKALMMYIANDASGFAPSPGAVNAYVKQLRAQDSQDSPMEAWAHVHTAIKNGLYGSRDEFEKLTPAEQRAVGSPEMLKAWAMEDEEVVNTVISSNFQKTYRSVKETQVMMSVMPEKLLGMIGKLSDHFAGGRVDDAPTVQRLSETPSSLP